MNNKLSTQEYLSIGYLYLLALGITIDVIYYSMLDVNILNYSSISDVLLSPLKILTRSIILPITLIFIFILSFIWDKYIYPKLKRSNAAALTTEKLILRAALMVFCIYLGIGIGMGGKGKSILENGEITPDHLVTFSGGKQVEVKVIGQNSQYLFFVPKGARAVSITLISSNVLQFQKLRKN